MVVLVASGAGSDNRISTRHGARVPGFSDESSRASSTSGLIFTAPISNKIQHTLHDSWQRSYLFWPGHLSFKPHQRLRPYLSRPATPAVLNGIFPKLHRLWRARARTPARKAFRGGCAQNHHRQYNYPAAVCCKSQALSGFCRAFFSQWYKMLRQLPRLLAILDRRIQ